MAEIAFDFSPLLIEYVETYIWYNNALNSAVIAAALLFALWGSQCGEMEFMW